MKDDCTYGVHLQRPSRVSKESRQPCGKPTFGERRLVCPSWAAGTVYDVTEPYPSVAQGTAGLYGHQSVPQHLRFADGRYRLKLGCNFGDEAMDSADQVHQRNVMNHPGRHSLEVVCRG